MMAGIDHLSYPRSAYLHVPFCHRRCFYCDFVVVPLGDKAGGIDGPGSNSIKSYLSLLEREMKLTPPGPPLATIYVGGGTPSLLSPIQISSILENLRSRFGFQDGSEISLEIDPASFDKNDLEGYIDAGINRVSIGGQSFNDEVLERIGRRHRRTHLVEACKWVDEFFKKGRLLSWSLDLIQGLPSTKLVDWEEELSQAIATSAPHLSIYDLSIEPGTVFDRQIRQGDIQLPSEELSSQMTTLTSSKLARAGLSRYEISNYAIPGHVSRHNRVYWSGAGWWAFGQGATSCPWGQRLSRPRTRNAYQSWIEDQETFGRDPSLELSTAKSMDLDEQLMVGLRRREGVDVMALARNWGWDKCQCEKYLTSLLSFWSESINRGSLIRQGWRFHLSDPQGMLISNHVLVQMMLWWDSLPPDAVLAPTLGALQRKVDDRQPRAG